MTSQNKVVPSAAGITVLELLRVLEETVGAEAYLNARERIPANIRAELDGATAMSWVPTTAVNQFIDEVARAAQRDPEALVDQATRVVTARTFKTVWRVFLRFNTDEALIKRTPMIYARARNIGQLTVRTDGPGVAELLLTGWPDVTERSLRTIGIAIQCAVELSGRRDVRISHARSADGGRYELRWRV